MESIILVIVTSAMCIWSFIIGAKVGQAVKNGEKVETPTVNPMEAYRQHQAKKEAEMEKNRIDTILRNIDSYNGTEYGQEEVK
jgi:hypothetical protein